MLTKLLREPFVHFALLGLVIYALINTLSPASPGFDEKTIVISQDDLVTYMQKRDQVFDAELYKAKLAALGDEQREHLVTQLVEQEVLYRTAKNLGLDQNDDVFRRRLVQKIKYFLQGLSRVDEGLTEQQIADYYAENRADYEIPTNITFTHLFFKENSPGTSAGIRAKQGLEALTKGSDAGDEFTSDHFPYHRNYVKKSAAQVARHFGSDFARAAFALETKSGTWQGPIASAYGQHLLRVSDKQPAYIPELAAVTEKVTEDLQRSLFTAATQAQVDELVKQYQIVVEAE